MTTGKILTTSLIKIVPSFLDRQLVANVRSKAISKKSVTIKLNSTVMVNPLIFEILNFFCLFPQSQVLICFQSNLNRHHLYTSQYLNPFEEDFYDLVRIIQFKRGNTVFQNQRNKELI